MGCGEKYCRWCANGGSLIICDKCHLAFCEKCIEINLGKETLTKIKEAEEWKCFSCDPSQIYGVKSMYYAVYIYNQSQPDEDDGKEIEEISILNGMHIEEKRRRSKRSIEILTPPRTFIEENVEEALKTVEVFRTCLAKEQKAWNDLEDQEDKGVLKRKVLALHKIYETCIENTDILDHIITRAYEERFDSESDWTEWSSDGGRVTKPSKRRIKITEKKSAKEKSKEKKTSKSKEENKEEESDSGSSTDEELKKKAKKLKDNRSSARKLRKRKKANNEKEKEGEVNDPL